MNESKFKPRLIVNAGGSSRRMGKTKALLPVPPHDTPLLLHIVDRLRPLVEPPVLVVANDPEIQRVVEEESDINYLGDDYPDAGPLGGLITGLPFCADWAMVVACDMPLINPKVFALLCQIADEDAAQLDAVVPYIQGYAQPLHALYHRRALPKLEEIFADGERGIQRILPKLQVRTVNEEEIRPIDPQLQSFLNVNRPEEWIAVSGFLGVD